MRSPESPHVRQQPGCTATGEKTRSSLELLPLQTPFIYRAPFLRADELKVHTASIDAVQSLSLQHLSYPRLPCSLQEQSLPSLLLLGDPSPSLSGLHPLALRFGNLGCWHSRGTHSWKLDEQQHLKPQVFSPASPSKKFAHFILFLIPTYALLCYKPCSHKLLSDSTQLYSTEEIPLFPNYTYINLKVLWM